MTDGVSIAPPFVGVVLTGGSSTRMGVDKALVEVDGVALAATVGRALRGAGAVEVVAVGGDRERLAALHCFDRLVPDRWPGEGPLGGILSAIDAVGSTAEVVVVLACDTPSVSVECARVLVDALGSHDVAVGHVDQRRQPLTAAWRVATCRRVLQRAFDAGERAPRAVLGHLRVVDVELDEREVADVDRPEDLARYAPGARTGHDDHRRRS